MRIVFDGYPLLPPRSGVGEYTYQLVRALARVGREHELVAFVPTPVGGWHGPGPDDFPEPNVRLARPGWWRSMARRLRRRLGLPLTVDEITGRYDVFHATNNTFRDVTIGSAHRIVTIHDLTLLLFPEWHPAERLKEMVPELVRTRALADHVLVDSESTRRDVVRHLAIPTERVSVVPLAADPGLRPLAPEVVEPALAGFGLRPGGYLLFLGTLEPRKNLERLCAALERLDHGIGPLVVVGADGWFTRGIVEVLERLEARGRARRLGYVSSGARAALLAGARAFVYPSLYEGFGLPPLEAMACGVPVLTSTVSSLPEVVGDAALTVDPTDVDALAEGLERLWTDAELRERLRTRGLERARRFTWEATARQTLAVYERVVGVSR